MTRTKQNQEPPSSPSPGGDPLMDYPFDLYQRTRDIAQCVETIAAETGRDRLRILDVGGFRIDAAERENLLLQEFLPNHRINSLDLVDSFAPGYVKGDGTQLPFKDGSFDVVVTSDVYEHVPADLREKFMRNLVRVSNGFVVLGAPFYTEKAALAEEILFEYVHKILHVEQAQLKEHIENGLPDAQALGKLLEQWGMDSICFDSGNINNWVLMMMVKHYLITIPGSQKLHTMLDRFHNKSFYESDHRGTGYRKVFVVAKEKGPDSEAILKKIDALFAAYRESETSPSWETADLGHIQLMLSLEELRTRRMFQEKDRIIAQQAAKLDEFNRMRKTRLYNFINFFGKHMFSPVVRLLRFFLAKLQQMGRVMGGKRRHPYLSISSGAYRRWIEKNTPPETEMEAIKQASANLSYRPRISVVVPVYNTAKEWLEQALESVRAQVYDNWELCLVNDGSTEDHVHVTLERFRAMDTRIRVKHLGWNRGIARATNEALSMASGEFIAFMDSDDTLHPMALHEIASFLNEQKDADLIYTDEDKLTLDGQRRKPVFKPGWSPELFLSYNYINHLTVCRSSLLDKTGGFRPEFDWSQDYDLYLRLTENTDKIYHLPKVLYHWRAVPGSSAARIDIRTQALDSSKQVLMETLRRRGVDGYVTVGLQPGTFKVKGRKGT